MKKQNTKDPREKLWKKQVKERGFDDRELWSLDFTISKFILPRLQAFKKQKAGYPGHLTEKKWNNKLDKMIAAFTLLAKDPWLINSEQYNKIVQPGLKEFIRNYLSLWS